MGVLADFFVATPEQAVQYFNCASDDSSEAERIRNMLNPVERTGITSLELGTLWAILAGVDFDDTVHVPEDTCVDEDGESWLNELPQGLLSLLVNLSPERLETVGAQWARTEEIDGDPIVLAELITDLQNLAKAAMREKKSVYLCGSL